MLDKIRNCTVNPIQYFKARKIRYATLVFYRNKLEQLKVNSFKISVLEKQNKRLPSTNDSIASLLRL